MGRFWSQGPDMAVSPRRTSVSAASATPGLTTSWTRGSLDTVMTIWPLRSSTTARGRICSSDTATGRPSSSTLRADSSTLSTASSVSGARVPRVRRCSRMRSASRSAFSTWSFAASAGLAISDVRLPSSGVSVPSTCAMERCSSNPPSTRAKW